MHYSNNTIGDNDRGLGMLSLALFAKAPILGETKTRLQDALGPEGALEAHCELVQYALSQLSLFEQKKTGTQIELWTSADHPAARHWAQTFDLPLKIQCGDDLGARMNHALADQLSRGAEHAVVMGCDCPLLDREYLRWVTEHVGASDVIIAPAEDGGYGLIGVAAAQPALFLDMPWGSSLVLEETMRRARNNGLKVMLGEPIWDVDRPEDWHRFQRLRNQQLSA